MWELWTLVPTAQGTARVRLVDRWIAVGTAGELLERDVWEVCFERDGLELVRRVRTMPEPGPAALAQAVGRLLTSTTDSTT